MTIPARCAIQGLASGMAALCWSSPSPIIMTRRTSGSRPGSDQAGEVPGNLDEDGIIQGRAANWCAVSDDIAQVLDVGGKTCWITWAVVNVHEERLVFRRADDVEQKIGGRLLLELQTLANTV